MKRLLMLICIFVPLLEVTVIIKMGDLIGGWMTFLLLVGIGLLGAYLVKVQGARIWRRLRIELEMGRMPAETLWDGLCTLVAGCLFLIPGFLTDIIGLLFLLPPIREIIKRLLKTWVAERLMQGTWHFFWRR
jgi:UPF0716 protein FxsA